jgi:hypothetical protein
MNEICDLKPLDLIRARRRNGRQSSTPVIQIEPGQLQVLAANGEDAIIAAGMPIYRRDTVLVRPALDEVDAKHGRKILVARLIELNVHYLRGVLCEAASWEKYNIRKKGWVRTDPPENVARLILANYGDWRFPAVAGVITTPTLRPDGTILAAEGYDLSTRLYLMAPLKMPSLPHEPTRDDAIRAVAQLGELLEEFPFEDEASRSVSLSAILSTVARGVFPVVPMHAARSPAPGSGKSYLWDTVGAIAIGQPCPVMAAGPSAEETEKRLGSALMAGQALISIDNVNGQLGGDALCQAIERPVMQVRVLGRSELFRIEARGTTIFATGNNLILTGDVTRRALLCSLDPVLERPELRQFKGNPVAKVFADRAKYVAAALTVVRAYFVAGQPNKAPHLASFEGWSDTVRSALIWLGCEDPVVTMERARVEDPTLVTLRQMLSAWCDAFGTGRGTARTAADVLKMVEQTNGEQEWCWPELRSAGSLSRQDQCQEPRKLAATLQGSHCEPPALCRRR